MIVVKVGGSLFDHPMLGPGLRHWLAGFGTTKVWLIAGGGAAVDAVRSLTATHHLSEEDAHWIAIDALEVTASLLRALLRDEGFNGPTRYLLEPLEFMVEDANSPDGLPRCWAVTTDSIAARVTQVTVADKLILLKSLDIPPGTPWPVAAANGWVDDYFPSAVADAPFQVEAVNFRSYLDSFNPPR